MRNVIVAGAAGFIGSAFCRSLANDPGSNIIGVDKLTYAGNIENVRSLLRDESSFELIEADISNAKDITEIFERYQPDVLVNFAAESHVDNTIESPVECMQTNIVGTFNLLEAARKHSSAGFKFIHISTDEVFGDLDTSDGLFTEETPYNPSSPYSASKASSDHLVRAWGRTYDLPYIITNCTNNYGPFQHPEKLIPRIILNAINGKELPVYGNGEQVRDWIYVDDHVDAILSILRSDKINETYLIGANNENSNINIVSGICDILNNISIINGNWAPGEGYENQIAFVADRPGHDKRYAIDATKLRTDIGWEPKTEFYDGLLKTVRWYLENPHWIGTCR
jgi:dTDP-glucose 4,6-dehydratase